MYTGVYTCDLVGMQIMPYTSRIYACSRRFAFARHASLAFPCLGVITNTLKFAKSSYGWDPIPSKILLMDMRTLVVLLALCAAPHFQGRGHTSDSGLRGWVQENYSWLEVSGLRPSQRPQLQQSLLPHLRGDRQAQSPRAGLRWLAGWLAAWLPGWLAGWPALPLAALA